MLFENKKLHADYVNIKEIEPYMKNKLKQLLGYDYQIFTYLKISINRLNLNIDETSMTNEMFDALQTFKKENELFFDIDVYSYFMNQDGGVGYRFQYLVTDLSGVYVIREKLDES